MDNFSNLMMINECLLDRKRVLLFEKAIKAVVKRGDIVLDAGSGSGIMSFFAVKAGAKKVFAVEIDESISNLITNNVKMIGLEKSIEIINGDVKEIVLTQVDVVVMEMLDTWFAAEQQIPALNHLVESGIVGKDTAFIPSEAENYIEFVNYNFDFYGYSLSHPIQARNYGVMKRVSMTLSERILVDKFDLSKVNSLSRSTQGSFTACNTGIINAAVLRTKVSLTKNIETWGTSDMNMPVIIPLAAKSVTNAKNYSFKVSYRMPDGFDTISIAFL
jgi:predicted RNA methylase